MQWVYYRFKTMSQFKFSVLISNKINSNSYNPYKQKLVGSLIIFKNIKETKKLENDWWETSALRYSFLTFSHVLFLQRPR